MIWRQIAPAVAPLRVLPNANYTSSPLGLVIVGEYLMDLLFSDVVAQEEMGAPSDPAPAQLKLTTREALCGQAYARMHA
jgi:hypothetical protein